MEFQRLQRRQHRFAYIGGTREEHDTTDDEAADGCDVGTWLEEREEEEYMNAVTSR